MRKLLFLLWTLVVAEAAWAGQVEIEGKWRRDDGNAIVRIAPCGSNMCATNLWIRDSSAGEQVGDRLVMTLKPMSGGKFAGTAFDPKRNLNYSITVTKLKRGLVTQGCVLARMLCKDVSWTAAR